MLYVLPFGESFPAGVEYRVLFEDGDKPRVVETKSIVNGFEPHPDTWSNGVPVVDGGCLAEWLISDGDAATQDIKARAKELFEQLKPLAYEDPLKVSEAMKETFTPAEIKGVIGVEV
jgi:hypothetical protein